MLDGPPKWGHFMGSSGSNRAPCGLGQEGRGRGQPTHGAAQGLPQGRRIGCVISRTPLTPPHITARLAKWHYDASSHLGHEPVFRVEVVNAMAPHSLGFEVNSISCSLPPHQSKACHGLPLPLSINIH